MTPEQALTVGQQAMLMIFWLSMPFLLVILVVGLLIGLVQAATQIQEQTLSFVPKLFAVAGVALLLGPWWLRQLTDYTRSILTDFPGLLK